MHGENNPPISHPKAGLPRERYEAARSNAECLRPDGGAAKLVELLIAVKTR